MQRSERRQLTRVERAVAYGVLGMATEVAFTGVRDAAGARTRTWRLRGYSYLWMLPIYGLIAVLYEPVHDRLRVAPLWKRAATYAAGFIVVEYASGTAIKRLTGAVPWDYTGESRFALPGGTVRLDYLPLWAAAGMLLERVDDRMRTLST